MGLQQLAEAALPPRARFGGVKATLASCTKREQRRLCNLGARAYCGSYNSGHVPLRATLTVRKEFDYCHRQIKRFLSTPPAVAARGFCVPAQAKSHRSLTLLILAG